MPESVTDRPTKSHEFVFMLTKSPKYFWDKEAVLEPAEWNRWGTQTNDKHEGTGSAATWISTKTKEELNANRRSYPPGQTGGNTPEGHVKKAGEGLPGDPRGRNMRSVWQIPTQPYSQAHFATFPEELPRRCILAGTSEMGCCSTCGSPWVRLVESGYGDAFEGEPRDTGRPDGAERRNKRGGQKEWDSYTPPKTLGWQPTCICSTEPVPCVVMDIFMGAGTTAHVARKLGRHAIGIELNQEYAQLIARRTRQLSLLS